MSTVNISHLGTEAEVQLAEALVAVSEAVVAAAAEGDDTPRVVAVEETTHSEDDAVMQQVCVLVLNICWRVHENLSYCLVNGYSFCYSFWENVDMNLHVLHYHDVSANV